MFINNGNKITNTQSILAEIKRNVYQEGREYRAAGQIVGSILTRHMCVIIVG